MDESYDIRFFMLNICYTLASQNVIINYWRSLNPDPKTTMGLMKPDPGVMFDLTIIICIPCTIIIVSIWTMKDSGLVIMEKVKGVDFSMINPAGSRNYRIIKVFAGVDFIYNFVVLIII